MDHTYTLTNVGFTNPTWFNQKKEFIVTVKEPRSLVIEDSTLRLLDDEPDLPVGKEVKVWIARWFHCETLEFIEKKKAANQLRLEAREKHEQEVKRQAEELFSLPTERLIKSIPAINALESYLAYLYGRQAKHHKIYKRLWRCADLELKQQSSDAYVFVTSINDCINRISEFLFKNINKNVLPATVAYAYSPREGGSHGTHSPGKYHLVLLEDFNKGRLKRKKNDALCKPVNKFWGLDALDKTHRVTCQTCLSRMIKIAKLQK